MSQIPFLIGSKTKQIKMKIKNYIEYRKVKRVLEALERKTVKRPTDIEAIEELKEAIKDYEWNNKQHKK